LTLAVALGIGVVRLNAAQDAAAERQASAPPAEEVQTAAETAEAVPRPAFSSEQKNVPYIGSVQVWNGCGAEGAGKRVADFLRANKFDVKDVGNAPTWNHPATMIISRTTDMGLANELEKFLKTGKVVLIRNGDQLYDVTVVAGPDFEERIK
jgi:hypothetical protein